MNDTGYQRTMKKFLPVSGTGWGTTLRYYRKKKGMTLKKLSKKCGYSVSYLSDVERGQTIPTGAAIGKMFAGLDILASLHLDIPQPEQRL